LCLSAMQVLMYTASQGLQMTPSAALLPTVNLRAPIMHLRDDFESMEGYGRNSYGYGRGGLSTGRYDRGGRRMGRRGESSTLLQGGSLRTWSYRSRSVEQVQILLGTEGRPLDADIELWNGPENTPVKMRVYVENGLLRPFSAVIRTPNSPNTVAIRNIGQLEFPLEANVLAEDIDTPSREHIASRMIVQGGALRTFPFDSSVDSVQVLLETDGRPLNARIELLQGPNNNKQVIELYTEDGYDRPFFCILETPGTGNVIRVVNTSPIEFPMTASVVRHSVYKDYTRGSMSRDMDRDYDRRYDDSDRFRSRRGGNGLHEEFISVLNDQRRNGVGRRSIDDMRSVMDDRTPVLSRRR